MTIKTQGKGINVSKKSNNFPQFPSGFREEKPDVKILERRQPWCLCVGKWDLPSKSRGLSKGLSRGSKAGRPTSNSERNDS